MGVKKGEKVDYAILKDGKPIMLFECKAASANLDEVHASQLYRYFSVTEAKVGVLTNGIVYRLLSDLEAPNKMDTKPFFEVNLLALDDFAISELKKFSKAAFEIQAILINANDLKYTREIKKQLAQEMAQPSDAFVRFFASRVYAGRMTQLVRDTFAERTKSALQQFISDRVSDRLKSALAHEEESKALTQLAEDGPEATEVRHQPTEDELHGYYIVMAVLGQVVDPQRLAIRDHKSYCSILLDDSNRKPICRFWFTSEQKLVGIFDEAKIETKIPIDGLTKIYDLSGRLKETALRYENKTGGEERSASTRRGE